VAAVSLVAVSLEVVVLDVVVLLVLEPLSGTTTVVEGEDGASRSIMVVLLVLGAVVPGTKTVLVVSAGRLANIIIAPIISARTTKPIIKAELLVERASVSTAMKTISSKTVSCAQNALCLWPCGRWCAVPTFNADCVPANKMRNSDAFFH
jgi:hypothetical protein